MAAISHSYMLEVLREMEISGISPSIETYDSLISTYARVGLIEESMDLKNQMREKGGLSLMYVLSPPRCQGLRKLARMSFQ